MVQKPPILILYLGPFSDLKDGWFTHNYKPRDDIYTGKTLCIGTSEPGCMTHFIILLTYKVLIIL